MKKRLKIESTSAWLLAVFLAVATFVLVYYLVTLAPSGDQRMEKILSEADSGQTFDDEGGGTSTDEEIKNVASSESKEETVSKIDTQTSTTGTPPLPSWAYSGPQGPEFWGDLHSTYVTCKTGQKQSPINIESVKVQTVRMPFELHYQASALTIENNGLSLEAHFAPGNSVRWGARNFLLKTLVLHTPSEHRIQNASHEIEAQFIHKDEAGETLIIASFFEESGHSNPALQSILENVPKRKGEKRDAITLDPIDLIPKTRDYFTYQGSLTQPPCTENAIWVVFREPSATSSNQVDQFQVLFKFNARPVQILYGREVFLTGDKH